MYVCSCSLLHPVPHRDEPNAWLLKRGAGEIVETQFPSYYGRNLSAVFLSINQTHGWVWLRTPEPYNSVMELEWVYDECVCVFFLYGTWRGFSCLSCWFSIGWLGVGLLQNKCQKTDDPSVTNVRDPFEGIDSPSSFPQTKTRPPKLLCWRKMIYV